MLKRVTCIVTSAALFAVIAGSCSTADHGYVQREWSSTLRELGIVPVFPPREDVFVGDVYIYGYNPESLESLELLESKWRSLSAQDKGRKLELGMSPRLARLDILNAIDREYRAKTPSFPRTSTSDGSGLIGDEEVEAAARLVVSTGRAVVAAQAAKNSADAKVTEQTKAVETAKTSLETATKATEAADSASGSPKALHDAATKKLADDKTTLADLQKKLDATPNDAVLQKKVKDQQAAVADDNAKEKQANDAYINSPPQVTRTEAQKNVDTANTKLVTLADAAAIAASDLKAAQSQQAAAKPLLDTAQKYLVSSAYVEPFFDKKDAFTGTPLNDLEAAAKSADEASRAVAVAERAKAVVDNKVVDLTKELDGAKAALEKARKDVERERDTKPRESANGTKSKPTAGEKTEPGPDPVIFPVPPDPEPVEEAQRAVDSVMGRLGLAMMEAAAATKTLDAARAQEAMANALLEAIKKHLEATAKPPGGVADSQEKKPTPPPTGNAQPNPAAAPAESPKTPTPESTADDPLSSRVNRLRLVGFPEFASTTFTSGDLSALVPIEALSLGFGASFADLRSVSVKVPSAESYSLSLDSLLSEFAIPTPLQYENVADDIRLRTDDVVGEAFGNEVADESTRRALVQQIVVGTMKAIREESPEDKWWSLPSMTRTDVAIRATQIVEDVLQTSRKDGPSEATTEKKGDKSETRTPKKSEPIHLGDTSRRRVEAAVQEALADGIARLDGWYPGGPKSERAQPVVWVMKPNLKRMADFQHHMDISSRSAGDAHNTGGDDDYYVRLISEVFYARALDVSINAKQAFGARAEIQTIQKAVAASGTSHPSGSVPSPSVNSTSAGGTAPSPQPASLQGKDVDKLTSSDLLANIQQQLGKKATVPGGSVQLISYSENSIGVRRVFDRPVAIGFRGVTLKVDSRSGVVRSVHVSNGPSPTFTGELIAR